MRLSNGQTAHWDGYQTVVEGIPSFPCEWCGISFETEDLRKQWVCNTCLAPRREAALLLRSLPFHVKLWRASHIIESPRVESYVVVNTAMSELQQMALARSNRS